MNKLLMSLPLTALLMGAGTRGVAWATGADFGPAYQEFKLTLESGSRTEALGPLFYDQQIDTTRTWAVPPLLSRTHDPVTDYTEYDLAYPVLTYDRFGREYRFQIFQLFSFAGGQSFSETNVHRFTLFPLVFTQRSHIPERNYTAVVPFYGHLQNRLFRDEVNFIMMPIYVKSRKRDVVTVNYVWPFYHQRRGDSLEGWQLWPFYGEEHKGITYSTNNWGDTNFIGGHERLFIMWPFYSKTTMGIGTTNPVVQKAILPLYSETRSPMRDSTTYFWPFGYTHTIDREKKYEEWDTPWPLIVFARGEGKTTDRVFPFFSRSHSPTLEDNWYLWPVYKYNRINAPPLDRRRTRILFFLYSDVVEKNTEAKQAAHRVDFFPLYTFRRDRNGNSQLQVLSILEPFLPNSKSIERNYSQVWALWRTQHSAKTGASSQSLLWNLYRRDATPDSKKVSLLFGLIKYQSTTDTKHWRVMYIPFGKNSPAKGSDSVRE